MIATINNGTTTRIGLDFFATTAAGGGGTGVAGAGFGASPRMPPICSASFPTATSQSLKTSIHCRVASSYLKASVGSTSSTRTGTTARWFWLASASSFLISSELLAWLEKTSTITRASVSALTIASWKFWPGVMSRDEIQQAMPRCSRAAHSVSEVALSREEWLMKTGAGISTPQCSCRSVRAAFAQQPVEVFYGPGQPLVERHGGLPAENLPGLRDVGAALQRVVDRQRLVDQLRLGADVPDHPLGQLAHRDLDGVAEIDRAGHLVWRRHHPDEALDEVVDIAEGAGLRAVAVDGDVLALQGLDNEVRHHAPVVRVHARPVGVEDAHHLDARPVLPPVVEEQRLGAALALVVAGARADRVDVAAIILGLGMDRGVAVDLAGRGLEDLGLHPLRQAQHVDRAGHAGLGRLDRIELVVHRRGRAGEVVDLVHLDIEREAHVVAQRLEIRIVEEGGDVVLAAGEVVVDAEHVVPGGDQLLAEMGAEEPGPAGDENALAGQAHAAAPPATALSCGAGRAAARPIE